MSLIDFIAFVISFGIFLFVMGRQANIDRKRRRPEVREEEQAQEEEDLKAFLRELDIDEEEEEELPEELRPIREEKAAKSITVEVKQTLLPQIVEPEAIYGITTNYGVSRANRVLHSLSNPQDVVIYHEILGPPKAFRDD
ncbi:MAG: hypothetical protein KDK62_02755 [Chlamydiia bacterium]|nr:hypothetical protein [Chlamydiia bacterium]